MKILLPDIETAPNVAYVWGLFKENIPIQRLVNSGYVLCWAAKWLEEEDIFFSSRQGGNHYDMLKGIHSLLDEADVVVHYNGTKFDIPTLNKEFILHDMKPPSPYRQIDLLGVARRQFRFTSNKLEYVAEYLGLTKKVQHKGFNLWIQCMEDNPDAWKEMEEYNVGDVKTLEDLYYKLRPWIKNHPNRTLYTGGDCPVCGSSHVQSRGVHITQAAMYQRFHCQGCGAWLRGIKNEKTRHTAQVG